MKQKISPDEKIIYGVVRVSPKGQIVIPVDLRSDLGIKTGDQMVAARSKDGDGVLLMKMKVLNRMLIGTRYELE
jgi:AbrB family looped-hinge helix DNA binding protein